MPLCRVGICEDEAEDLAMLSDLLKKYQRASDWEILTFQSSGAFLQTAVSACFDLVLLDIEMDPPDGISVARRLAELEKPPVTIFTTKSNVYAMKGYGIAIRYLQKPLTEAPLFEALDAAMQEIRAFRIQLKTGSETSFIPVREIEYLETVGHYVIIHFGERELRLRLQLSVIQDQLPQFYFAAPHKSYIVNLAHIASAFSTFLTLDSGARVPISRGKAESFNQAFFRFLGR